ncbi:Transposon Tf2-6 polyprotein-like protein, partial [Dinothrombium tinctorium]
MGLLRQTSLSEYEMVQQLTEGLPIEWKLTMTAARPLTPNAWVEKTNKPHSPCRFCLQRGQTVYHWHSDCPFNTKRNTNKNSPSSEAPIHPQQDNEAFIDTGSTISVISQQIQHNLGLRIIPHSSILINQADGQTRSIGRTKANISIKQVTHQCEFHVIQNFQYPILIGLDIGQQFGLKIDLKTRTASMTIMEQPLKTILTMKPTQSQQLKQLLQTHKNVFSQDGMDIGRISIAKHKIATIEHPPIQLRAYRRPQHEYDEIKRQVEQLKAMNL